MKTNQFTPGEMLAAFTTFDHIQLVTTSGRGIANCGAAIGKYKAENEASAAELVLRWNKHPALLAETEALKSMLEKCDLQLSGCATWLREADQGGVAKSCDTVRAEIRAALSGKAGGE